MTNNKQYTLYFCLAILILTALFYFCFHLLLIVVPKESIILRHYLNLAEYVIWWLPAISLPYFLNEHKNNCITKWLKHIVYFPNNFQWTFLIFLLALIITALISIFGYGPIPKTGDEASLLFQAKIFASGHFFVPAPVLPEMFQLETTIINNNRWFSMYQPGHPLILAAGCLVGLSWLVGPILSAGSIVFTYRIAQTLYDETNARLSTILLLSSPFFILSGSTYTVHNTSLFSLTFFTWMIVKYYKSQNHLLIILAGLGLGFAFITRAYTTIAYSLPIIVYGVYLSIKRKLTVGIWFGFGFGFFPFFLFQLWNNYYLTGNALIFPYQLFPVQGYNSIGFGKMAGGILYGSQGHTLIKAFINLFYNLGVLSFHTFGWPLISLLPFLMLFFRGPSKTDVFLISIVFSLTILFFLYWYNGVGFWGPRFYTEILPLLVILSVQGIRVIKFNGVPFFNFPVYRVWIIVFTFMLGTVLLYIPLEIGFLKNSLWGCKSIPLPNNKPALVLVHNLPTDMPFAKIINMFIFPAAFNKNDPLLKSAVIYGKYLPDTPLEKIRELFPLRSLYILHNLNNTNTLEEITR